ncbi:hypothetical protein PSHT_02741, partial [Puccinia striiformis]
HTYFQVPSKIRSPVSSLPQLALCFLALVCSITMASITDIQSMFTATLQQQSAQQAQQLQAKLASKDKVIAQLMNRIQLREATPAPDSPPHIPQTQSTSKKSSPNRLPAKKNKATTSKATPKTDSPKVNPLQMVTKNMPNFFSPTRDALYAHIKLICNLTKQKVIPKPPHPDTLTEFDSCFFNADDIGYSTGNTSCAPLIPVGEVVTFKDPKCGQKKVGKGLVNVEEFFLSYTKATLACLGIQTWAPNLEDSHHSLYNEACRQAALMTFRQAALGETFSRALPLEGQHDKNFFDYCCNRREVQTSTHVFKIYGNGIDRKGCLLVLTLVLLLYFEIFQAINPIGSTFRTQALKSGRSVVLQLSPPSIVVRSHLDRADNNKPWQCVHCLQYISEENLDKKVLCSLLWKRHHEQTPGNDSKNTMELLDFHRIPRLDHLLDLCHYQPHYPDTSREQINTFSIFSSDHASEHLIVCSERSIDWHHSCYRQHRSAQPWFYQTLLKKRNPKEALDDDDRGQRLPFDNPIMKALQETWKDHDCILQTSKREDASYAGEAINLADTLGEDDNEYTEMEEGASEFLDILLTTPWRLPITKNRTTMKTMTMGSLVVRSSTLL